MPRPRTVISLLIILFVALAPAWTQAPVRSPAAVIEYASRDDVIVIRSGKPVAVPDPFGFELFEGDSVQTGRATLIEVRMLSGGAVFKLAENTTFRLTAASSGETVLSLVYGRIRSKVQRLAGGESFVISAQTAVAGVRGTDFGMDVVAARGASAPTTNVYCFDGAVIVTAMTTGSASSREGLEAVPRIFNVSAGQMVRVEQKGEFVEAERIELQNAILEFWRANDFTIAPEARLAEPAPTTAIAATPAPEAPAIQTPEALAAAAFDDGYAEGFRKGYDEGLKVLPEPAPDAFGAAEADKLRAAARLQRGGIITGTLILAAGLGLNLAGSSTNQASLSTAGTVLAAASLPFIVIAIAVGP